MTESCFCQGRALKFTRGATLIHGTTRALCGIPAYSRQLTYAPRRRILSRFEIMTVHCALSGPFGSLHLHPALTLPDSLCAHEYLYLRFNGLVV